MKLLEKLKEVDSKGKANIIKLQESFNWRNHKCLVFEIMGCNLYELIKQNLFAGFDEEKIRIYVVQILEGLRLLEDLSIIHCDLKPENILLSKKQNSNRIKIIDFGSSCYVREQMYSYIQSRYYRAPEVILGIKYSCAIDMWSLGCIIFELYTGHPLFAGENEHD